MLNDEMNKNPSILLVDDVPENIQVLHQILDGQNYSFMLATNAKETFEALEKQLPDLILLDVVLPDTNGFEICKILKENQKTKHIPVIFLTFKTELEDKLRGFELGAVDYITKPFEEAEVIARVKTHIKLKKSEQELIELNATKDKLFSIIAHDLKNPLGVIIGFSSLLENEIDSLNKNEIVNSVQLVSKLSRNINNLLDDLLAWAEIQSKRYKSLIKEINISELINSIIDFYEPIAEKKKIKISYECDDICINSDENIIRTTLRNLVSNSIKFTNSNGEVFIKVSLDNSKIQFQVKDNGVGISDKNLSKIFNPNCHYTTSGTNKEEGTGMGLTLCKDFLSIINGEIWAESKVGEGSDFYFTVTDFTQK